MNLTVTKSAYMDQHTPNSLELEHIESLHNKMIVLALPVIGLY